MESQGAAAEWDRTLATIQSAAAQLVLNNPRMPEEAQAAGLFAVKALIAAAEKFVWDSDPAYPHLINVLAPTPLWGGPTPDTSYLYAPLHGDYSYRVSGRRGSAFLFEIEIDSGDFFDLPNQKAVASGRDFATGPNGEIEILLGREPRPGNWISIPEGPGCMILRQYFLDWETEIPADVSIERIGATYPPPEPPDLDKRREDFLRFLRIMPAAVTAASEAFWEAGTEQLIFPEIAWNPFEGVIYGHGAFRCGPDEAVILEVEPPDCPFWGFMVSGPYLDSSSEFRLRQTSINKRQAVLDDDGAFRAVIASRDPGVPNWLDTQRRSLGIILSRYYRAQKQPVPTLRTVPFHELRKHLPPTPVVTPAERSAALALRAGSFARTRRG